MVAVTPGTPNGDQKPSSSMEEYVAVRKDIRQGVRNFKIGEWVIDRTPLPSKLNIYLVGPQGSGKSSFIRTCYRALRGGQNLRNDDRYCELERGLRRTDDAYPVTPSIFLHDTRGQREFNALEVEQAKVILEGRAVDGQIIQQRKRYWALLNEFWRSEDAMVKTFANDVVRERPTLETEPHFVFLVVDPNQQMLLLEDLDFRECYSTLLGTLASRGVPHAILCTHGDTMDPHKRRALSTLPGLLSASLTSSALPAYLVDEEYSSFDSALLPPPPSSPEKEAEGAVGRNAGDTGAPIGDSDADSRPPTPPLRLPDVLRIVTNYTSLRLEEEDPCQDVHNLLVLMDAIRQADAYVQQRVAGLRDGPAPDTKADPCVIL